MKCKSYKSLLLYLFFILFQFAFLPSPAFAQKNFIYCAEAAPDSFNPSLTSSGASFDAALPIYNNLIEFEPGGTGLIAGLAESWSISPDGLVYLFHLRRGVKFHKTPDFTPTRDFNADDVVFSFSRQMRPDHPFHPVSGGKYIYFQDTGTQSLLKAVEKIDDYTVRFTISHIEAPFLANLAMPFAAIFSAEYADAMLKKGTPQKIDQFPVGAGPFVFVGYQLNSVIRYKAFDQHWRGRPALDQLIFAVTPDPAVRYAKLLSGECHAAPHLNPADLAAIRKNSALRLLETEGLALSYLAFQTTKKPFDDVRVRRAVAMAIDKAAIVAAVYQGLAHPANGPLPPDVWSYDPSAAPPSHDPAGARALLRQAGYPDGFETTLWAMSVQRGYNPNARRMAEMMQADLAQIGVRATIVTYEWRDYLKRIMTGEHDMALLGWISDNGDPDNFLHTLLGCDAARPGGGNIAKWCDPQFDALVVKAKRTNAHAERADLYRAAQTIFTAEAPWVPVAYPSMHMTVRAEVRGYRMDPFGLHRFDGVDLAPD